MKYLVMECHPGYAVVLDEKGRFRKAANLGYQVGQSVEKVVLMREPGTTVPIRRMAAGFVAAAACILVMFTALFQNMSAPYASVYMQINPEVRMDVDKENRVLRVEGVNEDGLDLVEDYTGYKKKPLETVTDELVDRATEMGYLSPGGMVHIYLDSQDNAWAAETSGRLNQHLHETFSDIVVEVVIQKPDSEPSANSSAASSEPTPMEIPVAPPVSKPESSSQPPVSSAPQVSYSDSDYGETSEPDDDTDDDDFEETEPEDDLPEKTPEPDSPYQPPEESSDSPYAPPEDGITNYKAPDSEPESKDSPYASETEDDDHADDSDDDENEEDD